MNQFLVSRTISKGNSDSNSIPLDDLPTIHRTKLLSCFRGIQSSWHPGWYYVCDELVPNEAITENPTEKWLTKTFGIHTDMPVFKIGYSFRVMFCWHTQSWLVSS